MGRDSPPLQTMMRPSLVNVGSARCSDTILRNQMIFIPSFEVCLQLDRSDRVVLKVENLSAYFWHCNKTQPRGLDIFPGPVKNRTSPAKDRQKQHRRRSRGETFAPSLDGHWYEQSQQQAQTFRAGRARHSGTRLIAGPGCDKSTQGGFQERTMIVLTQVSSRTTTTTTTSSVEENSSTSLEPFKRKHT